MSPVTLHLEYFGPYRDATIDFTKFSATPLFLISGKTGSGKTTIFDGMCYALFNQTSGVDREAKAMRSDFATPADQTRVTFTFTHRERTYEIVREPTQILAKKRGTGTTEATASVVLTVFEDDTEITQLRKEGQVRDYLQDLLQMDGKQFAQIVLLPQGQFRRFLIAPSEDKAVVLEQLFNTTIFARWTDKLKQQLRKNEAANRETEATLDRLQQELQWTIENQDDATRLLANKQTTDLLTLMATQQAQTQAQQTALAKQLAVADQQHSDLVRQDEQETVLLADRQKLIEQQASQKELRAKLPAMTALKQEIAELDWAQQIQPQWQERQQAETTVTERTSASQQATEDVATAEQQQIQAKTDLEAHQPLADNIEKQQARLAQQEELAPVYQQVADLNNQLRVAREQASQVKQRLTTAQTKLVQNQQDQQSQQQVVARQTEISEERNRLTELGANLKHSQQQLTVLHQLEHTLQASQQMVQSKQAEAATAQVAATDQQTAAKAIYQDFLRNQIAELSAQLTPGSPCPVCGSEQHPHPAVTATVTAVSEGAVKDAQTQAEQLVKQASDLAAELSSARQRVSEQQTAYQQQLTDLQESLAQPETTTLADLDQHQETMQTTYQQAQEVNVKDQQALKAAQKSLATLTSTATDLQKQVDEASQDVQTVRSQTDQLSAELATEQKRLPVDAPTLTEFKQQIAQLRDQIQTDQKTWDAVNQAVQLSKNKLAVQQSRLAQAQQELQVSRTKLTSAKEKLLALLTEHFDSVNDQTAELVANAMAALPTLAVKRQTLADFQKQQESLTATIADLDARTQGKPTPDRIATQAALAAAKKQVMALQEQQRQQQNLFEFNALHTEQLQAQVDKQAQAMATTQGLTELSGVVNGDGPNSKLGLERYVLQTYLRQILKVGNHRLKQLTNGRYEFVIDESQANSKKRSGLEINVYDDHVGEQRSVHTLSGGESFIASLALALALGEVIQQTTGSVDVDALFIDEGFGSLDEDALMTALESLETIEGQHRMIGIISHVSELRDQVKNQLQVIANANGESTISYHAAE